MSTGEPQEQEKVYEPLSPPGPDLVTVPMVSPTAVSVDEFARAAAHLAMFDKLRDIALRLTRPNDWHFFGDRPWPQRGAIEKIQRALGLNLKIHRNEVDGSPYTKRFGQDELGGYYIVTVSGTISGEWGMLEALGFTSSRDLFFAADGKDKDGNIAYKPLSQVKEENIVQAAYTNFVANAVMRYTGISSFTRDDLEKVYGVGSVTGHTYAESKAKTTPADTANRSAQMKELAALCMVMADGIESEAAALCEQMSAFQGKDGKQVPGKRSPKDLTDGRLNATLNTAKKWWTEYLEKSGEKRAFLEDLLKEKLKGGVGATAQR